MTLTSKKLIIIYAGAFKKKKAIVCIYTYKQNDTNIHIIKMPSNLKDKGQYIYHKVLISHILLPLLVKTSYYIHTSMSTSKSYDK